VWNWLSTGASVGEAAIAFEIETGAVEDRAGDGVIMTDAGEIGASETSTVGVGKTGAESVGNCAGAVAGCAGMF
jgi:hypothetical protein